MAARKIIRGVRVLCFDDADTEFPEADILIEGERIVGVGPGAAAGRTGEEEIDGTGKLAIPGLINGHFHSPANLLKGSLPGLPLELFMLYEVPPLTEQAPPARLVYIRTLLGAIEMLKLGITSVQDDAFFVPRPERESIDALMRAYQTCGIRASVALDQPNVVEYLKYPYLEDLLPPAIRRRMARAPIPSVAELTALYAEFIDTWHGAAGGRLGAAVSCSAPHRVTPDYLQALSELSRARAIPFYVHVLETKLQRVFGEHKLERSLVRYLAERDVLDRRVNLIHGIWIDERDMAMIADAGAVIAHNPVCNLRLGSGIMPFRRIREFGIDVCLGTDEALADDSVNLWAAAKMAGLVHNITDPDYRRWPTAQEILRCVFQGGARAMGREHEIGVLAPGYQADIALLDLDTLAFTPLNDLRRQLVYCESGSSVVLTMVAGEVAMRDGVVFGVDEEAVKREARELAAEYASRVAAASGDARELEPYYRQMYFRAAAQDVGLERRAVAPRADVAGSEA